MLPWMELCSEVLAALNSSLGDSPFKIGGAWGHGWYFDLKPLVSIPARELLHVHIIHV